MTVSYQIKKEIAWRKMKDGTMTLISPLDDVVLTVNPLAARIVELLAENVAFEEIVMRIQKETGHKNEDEISKDVFEFVQQLVDKGFLTD